MSHQAPPPLSVDPFPYACPDDRFVYLSGEYEIACAQLCGLSHYQMRGYVTVESPSELEEWLQEMSELDF